MRRVDASARNRTFLEGETLDGTNRSARPHAERNERREEGTAMTTFDPAKYKETTREQWQNAADAWSDYGPFLRRWLGPATELMLDMTHVREGSRVLDVAAGAGDQSLQAAERVGGSGHVLATDIAPRILERAAHNARVAGVRLETRVMDGENLDVSEGTFDALICRVGLIYFPDQQRALAGMSRALKPGGRLGAIVYSTPEKNPFFSIPVGIIRRRARLPAPLPGQPGPFSLGGSGVLVKTLETAGFRNVEVRTVPAPLRMTSAAECVRFERESFGALHQMLSGLDDQERAETWAEIETSLRQFEREGGFEGPCELMVGVGVK
jgi:SAM-dependent methyltransferase